VKNTLATVQSLAWQTAKHAKNLSDFRSMFEARIVALARAHDLLTKRNWMSVPLHSLLEDIVAPYASGDRLRIDGETVDFDARAALSMTMVLNELTTNAVKYGALSKSTGAVSVSWHVADGGVLRLSWIEEGGPKVTTPTERGFGTRLIERCVENDVAGKLDLRFESAGVQCFIETPDTVLTSVA
jgi:two-component sensor histidine kinase